MGSNASHSTYFLTAANTNVLVVHLDEVDERSFATGSLQCEVGLAGWVWGSAGSCAGVGWSEMQETLFIFGRTPTTSALREKSRNINAALSFATVWVPRHLQVKAGYVNLLHSAGFALFTPNFCTVKCFVIKKCLKRARTETIREGTTVCF